MKTGAADGSDANDATTLQLTHTGFNTLSGVRCRCLSSLDLVIMC